MTKQELLTGMAIECATWEEARDYAMREVLEGNVKRDVRSPDITKQDWLDMRERVWPWKVNSTGLANH